MIGITNRTKFRLPQKLIKQTLTAGARFLKIKTMDLSVVFVSHHEIKKLNQTYRRQNKSTDVLSFAYEYNKNILTGEIIICYAMIKKNAGTYHHSIKDELTKILIHSLLHLIGHEHDRKMERLENNIINKL